MSIWLQTKYILLASSYLEQFKQVGKHYNARCIVCGDSKQTKTKARGWLLNSSKGYYYYCHNLGCSMTFNDFLKFVNINLYYDYVRERYNETSNLIKDEPLSFETSSKPEFKKNPFKTLKNITQLKFDHSAQIYINSRKIPIDMQKEIYFTPKFKTFVNSLIPNKFESLEYDERRIVIPLEDDDGAFGFIGRSLSEKSSLRYITIMLDDNKPKVWGLKNININKKIYAFEGSIDAMFIPNSIASAGGTIESIIPKTNLNKENITIVYDNEPRSPDTIYKMTNAIKLGYNVCIWPETILQKDINEMVLNHYTPENLKEIIDERTYNGLKADLVMSRWKKV